MRNAPGPSILDHALWACGTELISDDIFLEEGTFLIYTYPKDTKESAMGRNRTDEQDILIRDVLSQVSGKWSLWVVCELAAAEGPMRFTHVLKTIDGITQKVLTQTLRALERNGFVNRKVYPQVPPRVEYELSELGRELFTQIDLMTAWATKRANALATARRRFDSLNQ
jgi:DNA-binding HxlR family transcriptional regulator